MASRPKPIAILGRSINGLFCRSISPLPALFKKFKYIPNSLFISLPVNYRDILPHPITYSLLGRFQVAHPSPLPANYTESALTHSPSEMCPR